jgi:hypothetical protein
MIYRIVFGFRGNGQGWAETHAFLNSAPNPKDVMPTMADIATKRVQMLGREFEINAIRVSRYALDANTRARGSFVLKQSFRNSVTTVSAAAEPADVALIVRGSAEPSQVNPQFDANQNQTFLGAPLDICVDNAGVVDTGRGGLAAAFASWRSAMLSTSMGWLANSQLADVDISAVQQNTNGTVRLTTTADLLLTLNQGQLYKARIRRVNAGVSPLNGEVIVRIVDTHTMDTQQVIGLALEQTGGSMRIYKQIQPFIDYGDISLNGNVGNHKRGRPFGSTPGRARKRIRG